MNLLFLNITYSFLSTLDQSVITDILTFKNVKNVINFHCSDIHNILYLQKKLQHGSRRILNIKQFNQFSCSQYSKLGIIVDVTCPGWFEQSYSLDKSCFTGTFWIIRAETLKYAKDKLSMLPIDVNSDVIVLTKENEYFAINEVYNTGFFTKGSFVTRQIGVWNSTLHLSKPRRTDLSGVVLKCAIVIIESLGHQTFEEYLQRSQPPKVDSLHKLKFYKMLTYLKDMYNYSYEFQRTNSWGYLRNGSFDGLTGALQRQEADIGGTPLFIRADRAKFINYVVQVWQSRPCFIFRHPKYPGGFYTLYTRSFTSTVWGSIALVLFAIVALLYYMFKVKALREVEDTESSISLAFVFITSAISQQGIILNKNSTCMKIVFFVTSLFAMILYQYYNGLVVSTLLQEPPRKIVTLENLLSSNLKAGVENVLYNKDYFQRTTDPIALEMYQKKVITGSYKNFFDPEYGMALVKKGGFAFHVDSNTAYRLMRKTFTEREICDVQEIQLYPPQKMTAVLKKGSPYKEHIVIGVRRMFEAGIMDRLLREWDEARPPCVHTPDSSVFSVSLRESSIPLLILVMGVIFAVFIFLCETIVFNMKKTKMLSHDCTCLNICGLTSCPSKGCITRSRLVRRRRIRKNTHN